MIHTNILALIESVNDDNTYDLAPLFLDDEGNKYERILNARAVFNTFTDGEDSFDYFCVFNRGDLVLVSVIERDFSDALLGESGNGGSGDSHSLTSCIIIGKVDDEWNH